MFRVSGDKYGASGLVFTALVTACGPAAPDAIAEVSTSAEVVTATGQDDSTSTSVADSAMDSGAMTEGSTDSGDSSMAGCEQIECDPGRLDTCPSQRPRCLPWSCAHPHQTDSTRCTEQVGAAKLGESCRRDAASQGDDCGLGLFCQPENGRMHESGPGVCVALCQPEPGGHGNCGKLGLPAHHCFNLHLGSLPVCMPTCDPLAQRPCAVEGEGCYLLVDHFVCERPTGPLGLDGPPGELGADCSLDYPFGCAPGLVCASASFNRGCGNTNCALDCGCCVKVCDVNAEQPDAACQQQRGEKCVGVVRNPVDEIRDVGGCVEPVD